ncbi:hypothetical protein D3C80_1851020 [compost metagenome]
MQALAAVVVYVDFACVRRGVVDHDLYAVASGCQGGLFSQRLQGQGACLAGLASGLVHELGLKARRGGECRRDQ